MTKGIAASRKSDFPCAGHRYEYMYVASPVNEIPPLLTDKTTGQQLFWTVKVHNKSRIYELI
jgi:hypothetical protein